MNFNNLIANVISSNYYSRPNHFRISFNFPESILPGLSGRYSDRLLFNTKSCQLPGRSLEVSELQFSGGYRHKKAHDTTFSELPVTFYLSEDLIEKQIFDAWQSNILDREYQTSKYPEEYYGTITVEKLTVGKNKEELVQSYTFVNAFPSNVGEVEQDHENNSSIDILSVQFTYHNWFYNS